MLLLKEEISYIEQLINEDKTELAIIRLQKLFRNKARNKSIEGFDDLIMLSAQLKRVERDEIRSIETKESVNVIRNKVNRGVLFILRDVERSLHSEVIKREEVFSIKRIRKQINEKGKQKLTNDEIRRIKREVEERKRSSIFLWLLQSYKRDVIMFYKKHRWQVSLVTIILIIGICLYAFLPAFPIIDGKVKLKTECYPTSVRLKNYPRYKAKIDENGKFEIYVPIWLKNRLDGEEIEMQYFGQNSWYNPFIIYPSQPINDIKIVGTDCR